MIFLCVTYKESNWNMSLTTISISMPEDSHISQCERKFIKKMRLRRKAAAKAIHPVYDPPDWEMAFFEINNECYECGRPSETFCPDCAEEHQVLCDECSYTIHTYCGVDHRWDSWSIVRRY